MSPHRIKMDVSGELQRIVILVHQDRPIPALKEMACSPRLGIEIVGIAGVYVMQYLMEVSLWGLQKEMVVVSHQTEAVDLRAISLRRRFQITDHSFVILRS